MTAPDQPSPDGGPLDDLLHALAPEHAPGPAPEWADQLGGWLVVAVLEWPEASPSDLEGIRRLCDVSEDAGGGRWMLAQHAPGGLADDPRAQMLIKVLRRTAIASGEARVALAAGPGWPGKTMLIGPAPEAAAGLFRTVVSSGRSGLFVDATLYQYLSEPAAPFGEAYRLAGGARRQSSRRPVAGRVMGLVALAAALLLGLGLYRGVEPPDGAIYFHAQPRMERGQMLRTGDPLTVQLEGEAGSFGTVVLLDSSGRWLLPAANGVNHPFTTHRRRWQARFQLDGHAGYERFFGLITPEPLPNPAVLVAALNTTEGPRDQAQAQLAALLQAQEVRQVRIISTIEIEHQR
jgi:hypothetical protein